MKKIDIVYGHSIKLRHGLNYVTSLLVKGNPIFREYNMEIQNIYDCDGIYNCIENGDFFLHSTSSSKIKRRGLKKVYIDFLKQKNLFLELTRYYIRNYLPAKRCVNRYIKYNDSDLIVFQDFMSASLYYRRKTKHNKGILIMHTSADFLELLKVDKPKMYKNRFSREWYLKKFNFAAKNVEKIVVLSQPAFNSFSWLPSHKRQIIYNGIEDIPYPATRVISISKNKLNFICVASVSDRKGQKTVIEAIALLSQSEKEKLNFYIVGDGPKREEYKTLCEKLGLNNIYFTGERADVPSVLQSMDVFILASQSEGLPISIIEALRAGLYIMTTDVGGCREMITPETGEIILNSPNAIANSISILLKKGLPKNIRDSSLNLFRDKFSLDNMINQYAKLFDQIQ